MSDHSVLSDIKERVTLTIRRHSDRGFLPYSGCNRVCVELCAIIEEAERCTDPGLAFDIFILVLKQMMKLLSHADTSSGLATDVIRFSTKNIDRLCQSADSINHQYFFDTIIKTVKNKVFQDWPDNGYTLLKSAVCLVRDSKQAQKIQDLFPLLGTLYDGRPYPEQWLITHSLIERLDGAEAAERYLMSHLDVEEMRILAVERALDAGNYQQVEQLCREALENNVPGYFNQYSLPWPYYLERLYEETGNQEKLVETVRFILFHRDTSRFEKLKELYVKQGTWEEQRQLLWEELAKVLADHEYAVLLSGEGETGKLLEVVRRHPFYVLEYGKQLAASFPMETFSLYESYILKEAQAATERRTYRQVCRMLKNLAAAGGPAIALELLNGLAAMYPRRPAMLEELAKTRKQLGK